MFIELKEKKRFMNVFKTALKKIKKDSIIIFQMKLCAELQFKTTELLK